MAQPPHFEIEGSIYFITTRLKDRKFLFTADQTEIVNKTILDLKARKEWALYAYVIMPNHLHLLVKPTQYSVSKTIQLFKGRASKQINEGNFWQKGFFDFTILTDAKFKEKVNYIHFNPVKWGLVERAEDYRYSTALEYKIKHGEVFYA